MSVTLAAVAGIVGTGISFDALMAGNVHELTLGIPPLLIGLWWAGHELGRSMAASRIRHARRANDHPS
jgi:hypothetical protein